MRHYLPVWDATLPARPASDAELPAYPGCVINSLSRMRNCLFNMRNYLPLHVAELPAGRERGLLPACLVCGVRVPVCLGNESTCLLRMRQYLLTRMLNDLSI